MRVYVDGRPVEILPGMKVRHVLIQLGLCVEGPEEPPLVRDQWGNLLGMDGTLQEGALLFLDHKEKKEGP